MRRTRSTFRPSPGKIVHYHPPGGLGVRVDSAVYQGYAIPPYYDSLVGKLIVHGKTRGECLMRLKRALDEFVVDGIETTLPLFRALVREQDIIDGDYHIHWLEEFLARGGMRGVTACAARYRKAADLRSAQAGRQVLSGKIAQANASTRVRLAAISWFSRRPMLNASYGLGTNIAPSTRSSRSMAQRPDV